MSGFPEYSGDASFVPVTRNPRTPQVVDEFGNPMVYGTTDNANANFPIDERVAEFIQYGVLNGSFARGPQADPYHDITDINPLSDWTGPVSVSGGAITAQWVADASSPSGYALQYTVNAGAASDEAYFEQIVPIGGTRSRTIGHYVYATFTRVTATSNNFIATVNARYLDASGSTVGASFATNAATFSADGTSVVASAWSFSVSPGATARFLRVRIDIQRSSAAATDTGTFLASDVRLNFAPPVLLAAETTTPASYGPATIQQAAGVLTIRPNGVASTNLLYLSDGNGLQVLATSGLVAPLAVQEITSAVNPASGYHAIYAKSADSLLYSKDDGGNEYLLAHPLASYNPHGAADHTDVTRTMFLMAKDADVDSGTLATIGSAPDIIRVITLADAATQGAYWSTLVPPGWTSGSISFQPYWIAGSTDAGSHTVRWSLDVKAVASGTDATAAGTTVTATGGAAARTANRLYNDSVIDSTVTPAAQGNTLMVNIRRVGADAADTYVGAVHLVGLRITFTADQ